MIHNRLVTENRLDDWVRGNATIAQGVIVELVYRLVSVSSPEPVDRRFPLGDSIGQPGPDGFLDATVSLPPFVPDGKSYWEIGTGNDPRSKATADYTSLTAATPIEERQESTFIFITPLSGRRAWEHTWKEESQAAWRRTRREKQEWLDVRVIDGARLIEWLSLFPAVEQWLAGRMGLSAEYLETPELRWKQLSCIGDPPPLTPHLFLANREEACEKLEQLLVGMTRELKLDTKYSNHVADFVAAYIASLGSDTRDQIAGRCLIVRSGEAWDQVVNFTDHHILVADFDLDGASTNETRRLAVARDNGHSVVYGGMPGGIPHSNRAALSNPNPRQVKESLQSAGYKEERARMLGQTNDGDLNALLRCLQNLSVIPEWAEGTDAAHLAIAGLLGGWRDDTEGDTKVVEVLSGNAYGEWIRKLRDLALRPNTPLTQSDGAWRVTSRYEAWYALGPRLFDEHLNRLQQVAVTVLTERDPQFQIEKDQRWLASMHGKVMKHSIRLRYGLAESLALLGSYPDALTSCSLGRPRATVGNAVREILSDADWVLWASLTDVMPLLAEAAPYEFLEAVEAALARDHCPFDILFSQEGAGITGRNYMTGMLWALETLAWDRVLLTRVAVILSELAKRDPGGNWGNRPANSLTTIFLPWLPQTCASMKDRKDTLITLVREVPEVAWELLLTLLPSSHQTSVGTRKPIWRPTIPEDWSEKVSGQDYVAQVVDYADLALDSSEGNVSRLSDLISQLDGLPDASRRRLLDHLGSTEFNSTLTDEERQQLWTVLVDFISTHRRFSDAEWALVPKVIDDIEEIAGRIAPTDAFYRHQRLFSERDFELLDSVGQINEQRDRLNNRRKEAMSEIHSHGGLAAVFEFACSVESPWRSGHSFGVGAPDGVDTDILPVMFESDVDKLKSFARGYVQGRFTSRGWEWADGLDRSGWTPKQEGDFMSLMPFDSETWDRLKHYSGEHQSTYWLQVQVYPHDVEEGLDFAVDQLIQYGRPCAAVRLLDWQLHRQRRLNPIQAINALSAALHTSEQLYQADESAITGVIKALQDHPDMELSNLVRIEWGFLPLLDGHHGNRPIALERHLAQDASFFCEVVRAVFRSKQDVDAIETGSQNEVAVAKNAYRLLDQWKLPPGTLPDGTFSGDELRVWIEQVQTMSAQTGHLDAANSRVGHVLRYVPADPSGLWIHEVAAQALNHPDASVMREGFIGELINSRGVFSWSAGQQERELADHYRTVADQVNARGYFRLASSLLQLADSYDGDAERFSSRDFLAP